MSICIRLTLLLSLVVGVVGEGEVVLPEDGAAKGKEPVVLDTFGNTGDDGDCDGPDVVVFVPLSDRVPELPPP